MTTRNNYTKAESGPSIEATVYYDTDRARWEFDDNFKVLESGRRGATIAYYIDNGNVKDDSEISFTIKGELSALIKYARETYANYSDLVAIDGKELEDLKDEILNDLRPNVFNYLEMNEKYDLKDTGLEFVPNKALERVSIRGYSQGDYAEVIYCPSDLKECWGIAADESKLKKLFEHYFYDAPIFASVTIDGTEYFYFDCPEYNEYEWKRAEFIAYVAKESGVDAELIGAIVPNDPGY